LAGQIAAFSTDIGTLSSKVEAVAGEFDKVTRELVPSVSSFCDAIDNRFGPAVALQSTHAESVGRSMQRLREMAESMPQATATLNAMLHEISQSVRQTRETHGSLAETANHLADVGRQLRQSIEADVAPSQHAMHEMTTSFSASAAQLSDFMAQGLGPATSQLAAFRETMAGLQDAVDAIKNVSHARADIDRLSESLARAAEISDAISALPAQIRDVLDQKVGRNAIAANSRGGFMTWLVRRPR
jgi:ABC-type transporter Mla subunit MlaD